jgi:hypothetical protein
MSPHPDLIDVLWCLVFGLTSVGGWLWFCWGLGVAL